MGKFIDNIPYYQGMGVYALVAKSDGRMYIGSSSNISERMHQHENTFERGKASKSLQAAVDSGERFDAVILEKIPFGKNRFYLMGKEQEYITAYDTIKYGYNTAPTTCCTLESLIESRDSFIKRGSPASMRTAEYINGIIERQSKPIMP